MNKFVPFLILVFFTTCVSAQNFTGQWKGEFIDNSTSFTGWGGDRCEYVLEIECRGTKVTGYSYTYFSDGGKRYYTICKLTGVLNKAGKYIQVSETERTKTNVPVTIRNCFQVHRLTYTQQGDEQLLEGTWVPVSNQQGDCGYGTTVLSRRLLQKNPNYYNNTTTRTSPPKKTPPVKTEPTAKTPAVKKPTVDKKPSTEITRKLPEAIVNEVPKTDLSLKTPPPPKIASNELAQRKNTDTRYEKRNIDLLKTIEIDNASFTVNLYDNGEIDGDSISLFFNGSLILSHKRLSDRAITLKLKVDPDKEINELVMYAENLGTIPPNTALMVVDDGDNRYEVRISSDLQKSGVIRFVHKPKKVQ